MAGWGDHLWGPDPWDGSVIASPSFDGGFILAWDDAAPDQAIPQPPKCRAHERFDLCDKLPKMYCEEDLDPAVGGTGDHHRLLDVIRDWLFGNNGVTGLADDVKSVICILDHKEAPDRFLSARLRHLGFDLDLPLTTAQKRVLIPLLVKNIYKQKGSKASLQEAFRLLVGIPIDIITARGDGGDDGFECGEDFTRSSTDVDSASTFVQVIDPAQFEIGKPLVITDVTAPFVPFVDTEITNIVSDRIYFTPQSLTGVIEAGAQVFCDRLCDQLEHDTLDLAGCSKLGADIYSGVATALYTFYVDIQRTMTTTSVIADGDNQVTLDNTDFVIVGSRIRVTDLAAPLNPAVVLEVIEVNGLVVTFDPVSLDETIEVGASVVNLFSQEEIDLFDSITNFVKWSAEIHFITRDLGTAPVEIG